MPEYFPESASLTAKKPNLQEGAIVTWVTDESSWIESLKQKLGEGPFTVTQTRRATYGTPLVRLKTPEGSELVYSDDQTWFYRSWLVAN